MEQQKSDVLELTLLMGQYSILRFDPASPALSTLFKVLSSSPERRCASPNSAIFNLSVSHKEISLVGPTPALFHSNDEWFFKGASPQAVEGGWVALRVEPPPTPTPIPTPTLPASDASSIVGIHSDDCMSAEKQDEGSGFHPPGIDFSVVGIMARISGSLARAGVSLFAISTFDTDYILFKEGKIKSAIRALLEDGFRVTGEDLESMQWIETLESKRHYSIST